MMRRIVALLAIAVFTVVVFAPSAGTIPTEAQGCAAEPSVWTEISFIAPGSAGWKQWKKSELYEWYWALPGAVAHLQDENPGITDEEIYEGIATFFAYVDRNGDEAVCVYSVGWIPGPAHSDSAISAVDNNANALQ